MRKIIVYGREYKNRKDVAADFGIDYYVLNTRIRSGMTLESALEMGADVYGVAVFGIKYRSLVELAKAYGLNYRVLLDRSATGANLENLVLELLNTEKVQFEGKEYDSLTHIANEYKCDSGILHSRIQRGWPLLRALTEPVHQTSNTKGKYFYDGKWYTSQRELANEFGFSIKLVDSSKRRLKKEVIEVVDILIHFFKPYSIGRPKVISRFPFVIYDGLWFDTLKSFCEHIGITSEDLKNFMYNNKVKDHSEALTLMINQRVYRWFDSNASSKELNILEISHKYKMSISKLESKGLAKRKQVKFYPHCTFDPSKSFVMPRNKFDRFVADQNRESENNNT